jgi:hypothetical protein
MPDSRLRRRNTSGPRCNHSGSPVGNDIARPSVFWSSPTVPGGRPSANDASRAGPLFDREASLRPRNARRFGRGFLRIPNAFEIRKALYPTPIASGTRADNFAANSGGRFGLGGGLAASRAARAQRGLVCASDANVVRCPRRSKALYRAGGSWAFCRGWSSGS